MTKRALISVSSKIGVVELARQLVTLGFELLSTGGTAALLKEQQIPVTDVSTCTGFPEIMGGRVKTLHPAIHGGILRRPGVDDEVLAQHHIQPIDLVVVNLYPFQETIAKAPDDLVNAIENIDIGGPTMVRAAAKNYIAVGVVVDPEDYAAVLAELQANESTLTEATRFLLAKKAFVHTAKYDRDIADYLEHYGLEQPKSLFPRRLHVDFLKSQELRYGENPHQKAAFYRDTVAVKGSLVSAEQIQGKELSYNNIADGDAALECVKQFQEEPACVIVKHANPCGVALAKTLNEAYLKAYETDPQSAFGGIIAFNRPLDEVTVTSILARQFVEVIIAPAISHEARALLAEKPNIRVLCCGPWTYPPVDSMALDLHTVNGGLLVQTRDIIDANMDALRVVTQRAPLAHEMHDLLFAWRVAKYVKSNAIVYAKNTRTLGIGAGQMSRVDSARIAQIKAQQGDLDLKTSVLASDAFFPFQDGIEAAAKAGVVAIIQPGGSVRDAEIIEVANEFDIAMVFTGIRHFRH